MPSSRAISRSLLAISVGQSKRGALDAPAEALRVLELVAEAAGVDQQLLGHAAADHAGAAEAVLLGNRHLGAVAGGDARRAHAARAAADDEQVEVVVAHVPCLCRACVLGYQFRRQSGRARGRWQSADLVIPAKRSAERESSPEHTVHSGARFPLTRSALAGMTVYGQPAHADAACSPRRARGLDHDQLGQILGGDVADEALARIDDADDARPARAAAAGRRCRGRRSPAPSARPGP